VANLSGLVAKIPGGGISRKQGIITGTPTALALNVDGATVPFRCLDPVTVQVGDTVAVDLVAGPTGQAEAWVIGRLTSSFRPATGTVKVVPASSPSITVTGTDGKDYTAYFITSYTPVVGDNVDLSWAAAIPFVTGKVGTTATVVPALPVAPPPPPPPTGTTPYPAADAATFNGAWSGGAILQGTNNGTNSGAWFYASSPTELAGRTITRIRFTLAPRTTAGAYTAAATVHLYAHTSPTRPAGDVSRTMGPFDVTLQPGNGPLVVDLPLSWAPVLTAGGGIGISGDPYTGVGGRDTAPDTGLLQISWTR
jgi:hypothetical protein